ncbi:MAG TPA: DoxX family protein [Gemmatimonadales bacterium]|jgi:putative oxidoreductase|nr:DoxX family protein [Gemmatimonadales bacterium]
MSNREDLGKLILRVSLAGILLFHGLFKLTHGVAWIERPLAAFGLPGFLAYGTYLAEIIAPILLVVGYKARLAALVIGFDMLMAMVLVLRPRILTINQSGGGWAVELEALILLTALAVFLLGSGRYRLGRGAWD